MDAFNSTQIAFAREDAAYIIGISKQVSSPDHREVGAELEECLRRSADSDAVTLDLQTYRVQLLLEMMQQYSTRKDLLRQVLQHASKERD